MPFQLADKTLEVLDRKFFVSPISYEGLQRIEGWEYPYEAIRETILNAIVHRDYMGAPIQISVYDDKLIVWNEGRLPDDMTVEDLKKKHSSRPHNPILASAFFKGGLIEAWGRGTLKIVDECKKAGLPEPDIEVNSGGISVTIFKNIYSERHLKDRGLSERQIKVVLFVKGKGSITNSDYRKMFEVSEKTAFRDFEKLVELKILKKEGEKKGTFYTLNV
ncbi:ATP-binding protein [Maribellus mangrovi]|uniref:ATP-binding protein n=1 Tax=Maribellus mangrovi TaxID=3133146 RepID=UPI0030EB6EBD